MHDLVISLTTWITNHPNSSGLVIFFTSFAESLAFVGLIMPDAALMLTAGALIATGSLSFRPTMGLYRAWLLYVPVYGRLMFPWIPRDHFGEELSRQ